MYSLHVNKVVIRLSLPFFYGKPELPKKAAEKGEKTKMRQSLVSELDLTKIQGKGDFPCPKCGVIISPEDESEDVYTILEEKLEGEVLKELVIQCNKCTSRIRLTGFPLLETNNVNNS